MGVRATDMACCLWLWLRPCVRAEWDGRRWLLINRGRKRTHTSVSCSLQGVQGPFLFRPPAPLCCAAETAKGRSPPVLPTADRRRAYPAHTDDRRRTQPPGLPEQRGRCTLHTQCAELFALASVDVASPRRKRSASRVTTVLRTTCNVNCVLAVDRASPVLHSGDWGERVILSILTGL